MKLNSKVIAKIYRNAEWELPPFDFKVDKADACFPFEVKAGFINATEKGNTFSTEVTDYSRFERIFTGFEAVIIEWEGSTSTYVDNGKLLKQFTTGKVMNMWLDNIEMVDEVSPLERDNDFLTERVVSTITAYTTKEIAEFDLLKMYTFPHKHGKVLFHIDRVYSYNNPKDNRDKYYRVIFRSVNDRLSHTGISINQYIQNSAPGEGYAYPQLVDVISVRELLGKYIYDNVNDIGSLGYDGDIFYVENYRGYDGTTKLMKSGSEWIVEGNSNGYIIDESLLNSKPIASMQIEIFGKGILSDVYFYGRPLQARSDERGNEITQPRQLLLNKANQANVTQRDITQPYARNNAYNYIKKSQLVVESWYDTWSAQRKASVNPGSTKKWMGALEIFYGSAAEVVTVNPVARFFGDVLSFGIAEAFWPTTTEFKKNQGENGTVYEMQPDASGVFDFSTAFNNNFYKNKSVPRLPVDYQESVMWSLKEIPLIGGFLNKLTLGLNRGWRESTDLGGKHYNVSGIIPSGLLNFYQDAFMGPKKKAATGLGGEDAAYSSIPLDDLQSNASPSSISKVDFATILNYSLTDQFTDTDNHNQNGATFETSDFNYQDSSGNPLVVWDQSKSHAITNPNVDGYAIDAFGLHFVGDADLKVTFFDENGDTVWTTKLKTLSNLTGSVRDWNTTYKVSSWSSPAGVVVDGKSPYRIKASDYTINISASEQDRLRNGFAKSATSSGNFETDVNGDVIRDANGNPISKISSTGVPEVNAIANYVDGATDNIVTTPQVNQSITTIQELIIPISPTQILASPDLYNGVTGWNTPRVYSTNLADVLANQKITKDIMLQFTKVVIKPTYRTLDKHGNVYSGTDDKTYSYNLVFNIVQTNDAQGYRLELATNYSPVSDHRDRYRLLGSNFKTLEWAISRLATFSITGIPKVTGSGAFANGAGPGPTYFDLKEVILIK